MLIDTFIGDGKADFMEKFANRLPAQVVAGFFGLTRDDGERCYGWISAFMNPDRDPSDSAEAVVKLGQLVSEAISRARSEPGDDLISAIVTHVKADGTQFSDEECMGLLLTAILGALETTVSALASTVMLLDRFPAVRAELIDEPTLVGRAVEEVLRMESPVHGPKRTVLRDVVVTATNSAAATGSCCCSDPVTTTARSSVTLSNSMCTAATTLTWLSGTASTAASVHRWPSSSSASHWRRSCVACPITAW